MTNDGMLRFHLRRQALEQHNGYSVWEAISTPTGWPTNESALLLCDVWDSHWCRGAVERLDAMVGRMNTVVHACRDRGVQIIHAPSGTMAFYADTPARQRMIDAPVVEPPPDLEHEDPPSPVDASDGGSDTGETDSHQAWSRQHPVFEIDQDRDGISDDGREVYNLFRQKGINHLLIMGVHTNMCVVGRSFAIKQMVRWGVNVALIRDLTDAMYNPAKPPYVSHEEGTRLVIEYIEKFWCPTVESKELI